MTQCEPVFISRASFYRHPGNESPENLALTRLIDEVFLEMPWYGARQMRGTCGVWASGRAADF